MADASAGTAEWTSICPHRPQAFGRRGHACLASLGRRDRGGYYCAVTDGL